METNPGGGGALTSPSDLIMQKGGTNIFDLPWEVLQEIFSHLDGKSLLICKRVCKGWKEHVHHFEQKNNFWYNNCQKEIPSWTQFDLLDNMFPSHWKDKSQVDWEEIYKCWCIWNSLQEAPVTVHKPFSGLTGVSSIKVSGEWLFISTLEGRGKLSAHRMNGCGGLVDIYLGCGGVIDFQLVTAERHPLSNLKPPVILDEIFDTIEHNEIWLELKDSYIKLGRTYCIPVDKIRQKVSHSYGYQVRIESDRNCTSIILKKTCNKVNGPELMEFELSSPYSQILEFWTNKLSVATVTSDKKLVIDAVAINWRTMQASLTSNFGYHLGEDVSEVYSWHGSLFVVYTSKRNIAINYNGQDRLQMTPIKKGRVTSVLFYAGFFILATDRGKLLIYKVTSPEDCLGIVVYDTPCWDVDVCQGRIIRLTIAEPVHHKGKGPVIVCATPEDIYWVQLKV